MSHTTILCATDLAASGDAALHLATLMAKATKKKLVLLHAMEIEGRVDLDSLDPSVVPAAKAFEVRVASRMASHSAALDAAAATALSEGVPVEVSVEEGRPWETILDAAARYDAGLVVLGDHVSEGGLGDRIGERLLGSTAERVVRHASSPVLVARGSIPESIEGATWLVAVDFSDESRVAVREAERMARVSGGTLLLVHVVPEAYDAESMSEEWKQIRAVFTEEAQGKLDALGSELRLGVKVATEVGHGNASEALTQLAAERDASFLVVGTRGQGRLASLLLGSTAERVLDRSPVPVLLTRRDMEAGLAFEPAVNRE